MIRLGLRANARAFALLVVVNAFVGSMVGLERTLLPALAQERFGLAGPAAALSFVAAFGLAKALANLVAGARADRHGRRPVLLIGWMLALPVPLLLAWAPSWGWVVLANVLLGVSQGLAWSATVIMKIDLAGPARRGLAMGLNEFAGYVAVGLTAWATGWLASSLGSDTWVYLLGLGLAAGGALLSLAGASETLRHAAAEAPGPTSDAPPPLQTFLHTSFRHPALSSVSQAGLVNNLNDGLAWGLLPVWYAAHGLDLAQIGLLAAVYPTVWGVGQLAAGPLSDAVGRKPVLVAGMWVQAAALGGLAAGSTPTEFAIAAVALGIGTALVYPTFLAAIGDAAHPSWRATAVGTYRLWRDLGYVAGALLAGWIASHWGIGTAIAVVAALTGLSGLWLAVRMPREVAKRSSQSYVPSAPHAPAVSGATETR